MQVTFTNILILLAAFSFFIVALSQVFNREGKAFNRHLLTGFLAANVLSLSNFILMTSPFILSHPELAFIGNTLGLLAAPILLFYAKSLTSKDFKLSRQDRWHALPFLIIFAMVFFSYHFQPTDTQLRVLTDPKYINPFFSNILPPMIFITVAAYLVTIVTKIRRFQTNLYENFSRPEEYDLSWLNISILGMTTLWGLEIINFIMVSFWPDIKFQNLYLNGLSLIAFGIGVYFLIHALKRNQLPDHQIDLEGAQQKYGQHRLSDQELKNLSGELITYFEKNRPEKEANLTLNELADQLPMTSRELSQVINRNLVKAFLIL